MPWQPGDEVVRREVWRGKPWMAGANIVVADEPDLLVTYLPEGAEFSFTEVPELGPHPWAGRGAWAGHGVLMLQRPGDRYAVWHFWEGDEREFVCWYLNLQEPFRRTAEGFDTQDLELDVVIEPDGGWTFKDHDLLETRVHEGRFTRAEADSILALGDEIGRMLESGERWWDPAWSQWAPEPAWRVPRPAPQIS
jgi:hypothetical protein